MLFAPTVAGGQVVDGVVAAVFVILSWSCLWYLFSSGGDGCGHIGSVCVLAIFLYVLVPRGIGGHARQRPARLIETRFDGPSDPSRFHHLVWRGRRHLAASRQFQHGPSLPRQHEARQHTAVEGVVRGRLRLICVCDSLLSCMCFGYGRRMSVCKGCACE